MKKKNNDQFNETSNLHRYSKSFSGADKIEIIDSTPIEYSSPEELQALLEQGSKVLEYYLYLIEKAKRSDGKLLGVGAFKSVYGIDDKAISVEERRCAIHSFKNDLECVTLNQRILNELANLGINVPRSYFSQFLPNANHPKDLDLYHIDQQIPGKCLNYYNSHSGFRGIYLNSLDENKLKHLPQSNQDPNRLCASYNLKMAQHRALTGQKFLPKFLADYAKLDFLQMLCDCHSENIHYSSKTGYWFIDMSCFSVRSALSAGVGLNSVFDSSLKNYVYNTKHELGFLNNFVKDALGLDYNSQLYEYRHEVFPLYIYNAIILRQFENMLVNNLPAELDGALPSIEHLKQYGLESEFLTLDRGGLRLIDFETICQLEDALKMGDTKTLDQIRDRFDLPAEYDFAKELDLPIFFEAMENTRTGKDSESSPMAGETTAALITNSNEIAFELE